MLKHYKKKKKTLMKSNKIFNIDFLYVYFLFFKYKCENKTVLDYIFQRFIFKNLNNELFINNIFQLILSLFKKYYFLFCLHLSVNN